MSRLSEKRDVQEQLINYLVGIGWQYWPPDDVLAARNGDEREPFLPAVAREQLIALNPGLVTEDNVDDVLRRLRLVRPDLSGNEDFLRALRGYWTVYDEAEKRERNLTLIDYEDPDANHYAFTQELRFVDRDTRRMDMVLWVNGFPVAVVENKSPTVPEAEMEAFEQVQHTYTHHIPEFLKFPLIFAACDGIRLHYGPTWNDDLKAYYRWKVNGQDVGMERLAKSLFDRRTLLGVLRDYVIFFRADDQTHKFVLRPHQMRTVEKITARLDNRDADSGLVWHTQGSGKSLTMIVAAAQLRRLPSLSNPTLLIVVDRRELETQMAQNLEAYGFPAVVRAESKEHLRDLLGSDYRGLIVTLIHKFDRMPRDLNMRDNVVVLVDEAHRSQEGDLGTFMRAALPNASYFGFTGTPIDRGRIGRGTFETFGKPDPQGYLDKYGIAESIDDKTTVPLYYMLTPTELHVDRETLEKEFFQVIEDAGVASIEELNRILDKADKLKAVLKADQRVDSIARHIAQHYRENVEPLGFKAFVVAVDREACALYKQALDRYLPPDYSRVVYTPYHKDVPPLSDYHLDETQEKQVRKDFRNPDSLPKILIVTEKLLTGYDAPVLYAMYLDKPLKDHTLLQAIARVNRPYPDKSNGLVVDYVGIFEDLQRALAFDAETVQTGLINLEELRGRFVEMFEQMAAMLKPLDVNNEDGRVQRIIDHFFDEKTREAFVRLYKEIELAYEILSPDPFLYDYLDGYALLSQVYQVVYKTFDPEAERRRTRYDLLQKTDRMIRERVKAGYVVDTLPLYRIDRDIANVVRADDVSERVKVTNLYRSLVVHIDTNQGKQPYLISIGEEVEEIILRLKDRQLSAKAALEQLTALAEEAHAAKEEQEASGLPGDAFALFWVLRAENVPDAEGVAEQAQSILSEHATWPHNPKIEQQVRLELYKTLTAAGIDSTENLTGIVENLLKMHRVVTG